MRSINVRNKQVLLVHQLNCQAIVAKTAGSKIRGSTNSHYPRRGVHQTRHGDRTCVFCCTSPIGHQKKKSRNEREKLHQVSHISKNFHPFPFPPSPWYVGELNLGEVTAGYCLISGSGPRAFNCSVVGDEQCQFYSCKNSYTALFYQVQ